MSNPNFRNGLAVGVPNLDQYVELLQEVLPVAGATSLRPNLLDALERLARDLTPPGQRRIYQCFVWQHSAEIGLTVLLLNATTDIVKLDQQVSQSSSPLFFIILTHNLI